MRGLQMENKDLMFKHQDIKKGICENCDKPSDNLRIADDKSNSRFIKSCASCYEKYFKEPEQEPSPEQAQADLNLSKICEGYKNV